MSSKINTNIEHNIHKIYSQIKDYCYESNRDPKTVKLLAVSKTKSIAEMMCAYECGQTEFGENYLQEAVEKIIHLPSDITWHFIGHIQSKKIKQIVDNFSWIHTIGRLKIAEKLVECVTYKKKTINICLQINIDIEDSKSGFLADISEHDLSSSIYLMKSSPYINLRGLMCIPSIDSGDAFRRMKLFLDDLNQKYNLHMDVLSMGMSGDMEAAIREGSTIVRIGTAIFGNRA